HFPASRQPDSQFVRSITGSFKFYRTAFDRASRDLNVFEWHSVIGKLLVILVTFARDQYDVTWLGELDRARNCRRPIGDLLKMIVPKTFFDVGDDFVRIFFARIIGRDDRVIGFLIDDLSHQRPFLTIAISAATENDDEATRFE